MSESDFLAAVGAAAVPFEVSGVTVLIHPLGAPEAIAHQEYVKANPEDKAGALAKLLALSVELPGGARLSESSAARLPFAVAGKIADRIGELNGWGEDAGN